MNKASIYYYFKNKAAILYELASRTMEELINQALPILNSKLRPEEKLKVFIISQMEFELAHLGLSGIWQMERRILPNRLRETYTKMRDEYEGIFRKILEEGVRQRRFRYIDTELTSRFILGFLNSIIQWFKSTGKLSSVEVASAAYTFVSYSLNSKVAPKAPEELPS
jgi:AcrR family transcriptional regulator